METALREIGERVRSIRATLPADGSVELVAVSKFHPAELIRRAYDDAGQRSFGESRLQELLAKQELLPADIRWHFIGHVQTNKVRQLVKARPYLIESVDSLRLLDMIDRESLAQGVVSRVLLQVHVAAEETKFGFTPQELLDYFASGAWRNLRATHICGLMAMATNTDDRARVSADFQTVAALKKQIQELCPDLRGFDVLSMGMSDDYPLAIAAGSTHVRVGTAIFGERDYSGNKGSLNNPTK